ncbi:MAG: CapA family protein, partial [Bacteroidota bacterium]
CKYVGLANNHTLDRPKYFSDTTDLLEQHGIAYSGAGLSQRASQQPWIGSINGEQTIVFNACWHVMLQHQQNPSESVFVNTIKEDVTLTAVAKHRSDYPDARIVVFPHWNFDLETLPFPLHRQWAKALIDAGANLVAGSHSHCVQGGERHKDGYILYGLGNFFIPWYTFKNGKLDFPDFARLTVALDWKKEQECPLLHFFEYAYEDGQHELRHLSSESFLSSPTLARYSPYDGMKEQEYVKYFQANRRKKLLVPVYKDYRSQTLNRLKDIGLIARIRLARKLAASGLRKWNN